MSTTVLGIFAKNKVTPEAAIVDLGRKITAETGNLESLQMRHGEAALTAELDEEAGRELGDVALEITQAKGRLSSLNAALAEAQRAKSEKDRMAAEAARKAKEDNYKAKLDRHAKQADRVRAAVAKLKDEYVGLIETDRECLTAEPNNALPPLGSIMDAHLIHDAVADEIARQTPASMIAISDTERSRIPGSSHPTMIYDPVAIKPLHEAVIDSNAFSLKVATQRRN